MSPLRQVVRVTAIIQRLWIISPRVASTSTILKIHWSLGMASRMMRFIIGIRTDMLWDVFDGDIDLLEISDVISWTFVCCRFYFIVLAGCFDVLRDPRSQRWATRFHVVKSPLHICGGSRCIALTSRSRQRGRKQRSCGKLWCRPSRKARSW